MMRVTFILVISASACASTNPPAPQPEIPIRTQAEIAKDQEAGVALIDLSQCTGNPRPAGCPESNPLPSDMDPPPQPPTQNPHGTRVGNLAH